MLKKTYCDSLSYFEPYLATGLTHHTLAMVDAAVTWFNEVSGLEKEFNLGTEDTEHIVAMFRWDCNISVIKQCCHVPTGPCFDKLWENSAPTFRLDLVLITTVWENSAAISI